MNKYSDLTLLSKTKGDLFRHIRELEAMIEKYEVIDDSNKRAVEYIKSHIYNETTRKYSYDLTNREVKELLEILGDKE